MQNSIVTSGKVTSSAYFIFHFFHFIFDRLIYRSLSASYCLQLAGNVPLFFCLIKISYRICIVYSRISNWRYKLNAIFNSCKISSIEFVNELSEDKTSIERIYFRQSFVWFSARRYFLRWNSRKFSPINVKKTKLKVGIIATLIYHYKYFRYGQ